MEEDRKKLTEKKLLSCGKREFLEKGYAKANLRSICEASGVTTGAFYFSFASKEALLRAILDPFIADSRELLSGLARMEEEHPETADDNEIQIIRYLSAPVSYTHLRAHETGRNLVCRLLLEKKTSLLYTSPSPRD